MSGGATRSLLEDEWLSAQLGCVAYHLNVRPGDGPSVVIEHLRALPESGYFVDAKLPVTETELTTALVASGFALVETAVTLDLLPGAWPGGSARTPVRLARAEDADRVASIARDAFRYSRFHTDPRIDRARADTLKSEWAANYFRGLRGQAMVVADDGDGAIAFLQLLVGVQLTIDLIGVSAAARRRGIARDMITFALDELRPPGGATIVGTQVANIPSLRLYESLGFRICAARNVLHLHP